MNDNASNSEDRRTDSSSPVSPVAGAVAEYQGLETREKPAELEIPGGANAPGNTVAEGVVKSPGKSTATGAGIIPAKGPAKARGNGSGVKTKAPAEAKEAKAKAGKKKTYIIVAIVLVLGAALSFLFFWWRGQSSTVGGKTKQSTKAKPALKEGSYAAVERSSEEQVPVPFSEIESVFAEVEGHNILTVENKSEKYTLTRLVLGFADESGEHASTVQFNMPLGPGKLSPEMEIAPQAENSESTYMQYKVNNGQKAYLINYSFVDDAYSVVDCTELDGLGKKPPVSVEKLNLEIKEEPEHAYLSLKNDSKYNISAVFLNYIDTDGKLGSFFLPTAEIPAKKALEFKDDYLPKNLTLISVAYVIDGRCQIQYDYLQDTYYEISMSSLKAGE